ncbi:MAG: DUF1499 domain-containing protein [Gemmatimonadota bacterium]|nr:DUF1499 domain-containing protein [Gemmatimonadota bacterium]
MPGMDPFTRNRARTYPEASDPRLRGRRYGVEFAAVWRAVLAAAEASPRWSVVAADPVAGELRAEARSRVWGLVDDVVVRVSLDEDALTRVDMESASRAGRGDLGANARRIARFLGRLDAHLAATPPSPPLPER